MVSDDVKSASDQPTKDASSTAGELKIAISKYGPKCPHCAGEGFDDWWHERGLKAGDGIVRIEGRLKCHGCGKFFRVRQYHDGECHSEARSRLRSPAVSERDAKKEGRR